MKATWASIALSLAGAASTTLFAGELTTADGSAELVSKVYDLGHLRMRERGYESEDVVLFPTSQARVRMGDAQWEIHEDSFLELVGCVLWEEIEYDGRTMDPSGDGHLYLKAPASAHADLEALLGFYENLCTAETQMQLFWVQVPDGTQAPSGLVSANTATDWIDTLPNGTWSGDILAVPAYRAGVVKQIHNTPVMTDVDVEIAQGSAVADDVVRSVGSGRWAMVHAIPSIGGLQLSLTWSEVSRPVLTDTALEVKALLGSETTPLAPVDQGGTIQLMHQNANTSSTRVFVPSGMASVSKVSTHEGVSTLLIAVPHTQAPLEQTYQLSGPRKDRGVAFLMRSLVPLQTRWQHEGSFGSSKHWSDEWCWRTQSETGEWIAERVLEGIATDLVEYRQAGGYVILHTARGVSRDQLQIAHMELDRAANRLRALVSKKASYKVTLSGHDGGPESVFEIEQVVEEGSRSFWFCGAERTFVREFDVEVAQYAAIQDPNVNSRMEGSMIELLLATDSKGKLQVLIDARLSLPTANVNLGRANTMHAHVKGVALQQARFNTLQKLMGGGKAGAWQARFGGHGDGAIYLDLKVELLD